MRAFPGSELNLLSGRWGEARSAREEGDYLWVAILRLYPSLPKLAGRALSRTFCEEVTHASVNYLIGWTDESLEFACEQVALCGYFLWDGRYWWAKGFGRKSRAILWDAIQQRHDRGF